MNFSRSLQLLSKIQKLTLFSCSNGELYSIGSVGSRLSAEIFIVRRRCYQLIFQDAMF